MSLDVAGETVTLTLELPQAVYSRLHKLAEHTKDTEAFLAAYMVDEYLPALEKQVALNDEALAEANDPSTKWISQEEMEVWLDSWGADHELPPPGE